MTNFSVYPLNTKFNFRICNMQACGRAQPPLYVFCLWTLFRERIKLLHVFDQVFNQSQLKCSGLIAVSVLIILAEGSN